MVFIYPVEFQEYMPGLTEAFVEACGGKQLIKKLLKKVLLSNPSHSHYGEGRQNHL